MICEKTLPGIFIRKDSRGSFFCFENLKVGFIDLTWKMLLQMRY